MPKRQNILPTRASFFISSAEKIDYSMVDLDILLFLLFYISLTLTLSLITY